MTRVLIDWAELVEFSHVCEELSQDPEAVDTFAMALESDAAPNDRFVELLRAYLLRRGTPTHIVEVGLLAYITGAIIGARAIRLRATRIRQEDAT